MASAYYTSLVLFRPNEEMGIIQVDLSPCVEVCMRDMTFFSKFLELPVQMHFANDILCK